MQKYINKDAQEKRRKDAKKSALISSISMFVIGSLLITLRFYYDIDGIGGLFLLFCGVTNIMSIIPLGILLKTRLKEIEGGEEDVAAQY